MTEIPCEILIAFSSALSDTYSVNVILKDSSLRVPAEALIRIGEVFTSLIRFEETLTYLFVQKMGRAESKDRLIRVGEVNAQLLVGLYDSNALKPLLMQAIAALVSKRSLSASPIQIRFTLADLIELIFMTDVLQATNQVYSFLVSKFRPKMNDICALENFSTLCLEQLRKQIVPRSMIVRLAVKLNVQCQLEEPRPFICRIYSNSSCQSCSYIHAFNGEDTCNRCGHLVYCPSCFLSTGEFKLLSDGYYCRYCKKKQKTTQVPRKVAEMDLFKVVLPGLWLFREIELGNLVDPDELRDEVGVVSKLIVPKVVASSKNPAIVAALPCIRSLIVKQAL